ncbi:MAG: LytR C-terminal domain-containing protein [Candidatus Paceibacterota bacterium]
MSTVYAQNALTLSVTPSLFQVSAEPGQQWQSSVKMVNTNSYPITVYAEAVNFAPRDEAGHGKFIPVFAELTEGTTLAEWIHLDKEQAITIEPEASAVIPLTILVPEDASPVGHFGAILIGTRPPGEDSSLAVKTSQIVSSLLFMRIEGDVVEKGVIRSFSVAKRLVETPDATFNVRFENRGNVHLQPQGQIVISNMWGKRRGVIPINYSTHFGNVLPDSIRTFTFDWHGERSWLDIGRYHAEVSLAYGNDLKNFETRELAFWVLPLKPLFITLLVIVFSIWFLTWMVRRYIERMLLLAGVPTQQRTTTILRRRRSHLVYDGDLDMRSYRALSAPVRSGVSDLLTRLRAIKALPDLVRSLGQFIYLYQKFFFALFGVGVLVVLGYWYIYEVTTTDRPYDVSIQNPDQTVALNSEEIQFQELIKNENQSETGTVQSYDLHIVNTSGVPGAAALVSVDLYTQGYQINKVGIEEARVQERTVIVYDLAVQEEALLLSKRLDNALLSSRPGSEDTSNIITVFVGKDLTSK